jgi:hypothetical protein
VFKHLEPLRAKGSTEAVGVIEVNLISIQERTKSSFYSVGTLKIKVHLNNKVYTIVILDTSTEINIITLDLVKRAGLAMTLNPSLLIIAHRGEQR